MHVSVWHNESMAKASFPIQTSLSAQAGTGVLCCLVLKGVLCCFYYSEYTPCQWVRSEPVQTVESGVGCSDRK